MQQLRRQVQHLEEEKMQATRKAVETDIAAAAAEGAPSMQQLCRQLQHLKPEMMQATLKAIKTEQQQQQ